MIQLIKLIYSTYFYFDIEIIFLEEGKTVFCTGMIISINKRNIHLFTTWLAYISRKTF